jgi:hypothetical protein
MFYFVAYAVFINLVQYCFVQFGRKGAQTITSDLLSSSVFLIFNYLVVTFCSIISNSDYRKVHKALYYGVIVASMMLFIALLLSSPFSGTRKTAGFNNPNQLAMYSIILATANIFIGKKYNSMVYFLLTIVLAFCMLNSLSRGGIISFAVMILLDLLNNKEKSTNHFMFFSKIVMFVGFAVFLYIVFFNDKLFSSNTIISQIRMRMMSLEAQIDSAGQVRGYDRIYDLGINILWGMGEGASFRYSTLYKGEIHSTLMSILCAYGIVGLYLFIKLVLCSGEGVKDRLKFLCVFSGVITLSLSHNTIRNTVIWIYLYIYYVDQRETHQNEVEYAF